MVLLGTEAQGACTVCLGRCGPGGLHQLRTGGTGGAALRGVEEALVAGGVGCGCYG